ncbi:MAG: DegT/DnrJ/EryC1/StrS aminotransferase family protein [Pseudomonadota bacterium]
MNTKIPVSEPFIDENENRLITEALSKKAISGYFGEHIAKFENDFARYSDCSHGVATNSGTTALHLAVSALPISQGDEILISTLTNMATFFAAVYQGVKPIPVDIDLSTYNINPSLIEEKITAKTKAIIVVHLFGHPVDMNPIIDIAKKHNLYLIEDCAQSHGATYVGKKVGSFGHFGCFSFYANKIITTGEGGMVTTNDPKLAERVRSLKGLAFGDKNKFMHKDVGYNYRMPNLQAAIGCAQLGKIEDIILCKRRLAANYYERLKDIADLILPSEKAYARNVYWMYHIRILGQKSNKRDLLMKKLLEMGIETREGFIPYNLQEIFINRGWTKPGDCPRANEVAYSTFYLPSSPTLSEDEADRVCTGLISVLKSI